MRNARIVSCEMKRMENKNSLRKKVFEISKNASAVPKMRKEIPKSVEKTAWGPNLGSLGGWLSPHEVCPHDFEMRNARVVGCEM